MSLVFQPIDDPGDSVLDQRHVKVRLLRERAKDMAAVPGGRSGLLCREFKDKDGEKESFRIDPGVMALLGELRTHERQASEELGQWGEKREDHGSHFSVIVERLNAGRRRVAEARSASNNAS